MRLRVRLAPHAHQCLTYEALTSRFGDDPRSHLPRRIVPNVLAVAALEIGNPMLLFILVKTDNAAFDH
jgi:hypothetical protein